MSESRSFLQQSLGSLRPELSGPTQAHMTIPIGLVRTVRQSFEGVISAHRAEPDTVYIDRALRNVTKLLQQNREYAEQLRLAEDATLFSLPEHLVHFLRDHDNLYRVGIRNRLVASMAIRSLHMDVLVKVVYRLRNIRTFYYINFAETTGSVAEHIRLKHHPVLQKEFSECTASLQDEVINQLTHAHHLLPSPAKDTELENIGPDHNVSDHGQEVSPSPTHTHPDARDHSKRCCICLEPYTNTIIHRAFRITACNHVIGKPCLAHWLNSTTRNANRCPHCRTPLFERRARQPVGMTPAALAQQRTLADRVSRTIAVIRDVEKLQMELFGSVVANAYITETMDELNYRLFQTDVEFCVVRRGAEWVAGRFTWH
ncbi:uncharacterized protein EKO05_0009551 [Ascochyta rabiei]|uniref:Zinc ion binding n=1 Tax=Didymella rabiei TaxID=5454 RepID=A0A163CQY8_DIDRA|nr:uncharacterized protein EKO05_0009551 [Ascochyta rabiei]KZM22633.1 zinc ion binding [Ascochyta rabiei]UPX19283.1 hypothetical protein EKO05_0009551 [Ascochyta rabiei]